MKKLVLITLLFAGSVSFAAQINSGSFNARTQKVELNVTYGGGCSEHSFKLELINGCRESFPVQCDLNLVHTADKPDFCEALISKNLELDLPNGMLNDSYFERAFLSIFSYGELGVIFQLPN